MGTVLGIIPIQHAGIILGLVLVDILAFFTFYLPSRHKVWGYTF